MKELQIFKNSDFGELEILVEEGKELFPAAECARILGYTNPQKAIRDHCRGGTIRSVGVQTGLKLDGSKAMQEVNKVFIPEGDLYRLIIKSQLPAAEKFEKWVFEDVLPSIRKHGAYMTDTALERALTDPDFLIRLANELKGERALRNQMQNKIEIDKPKVLFADAVWASKTSILVGELAKLLNQNGINIGQNRLFKILRAQKYLISRGGSDWNMPTQRSMEMGLFEIKEHTYIDSNGCNVTSKTPKITAKGQLYFINKFLA